MTDAAVRDRPRGDLRVVVPALAAWVTAMVLLGRTVPVVLATAAATALGAGLLLARSRNVAWANVAAASLACSAAAAVAVGLRLAAVAAGPLAGLAADHAHATIDVVVTGGPEIRRAPRHVTVTLPARAERVEARGQRVTVRSPVLLIVSVPARTARTWISLLPSQRIRVSCRLGPPRHDPTLAAVVFCRGPPEVVGAPSRLQQSAGALRSGLRAAAGPLPAAERGILPALVVGDTSLLDPAVEEDFRRAGLTHLLVVSGANVAIVLGTVLVVARWVGLGVRIAPLLGGIAVLGFAVVARPEPSVLRATVMGLVTVVALATGRERQGIPALGAAVLALVLFDPALARSYGFALSVLATGGLLILAPTWRDRLGRRMPGWLAEALAIPAAAQVACAPVLVMLTGQVSVVAVLANLVAAPAVAPATVLGLLAALAAQVHLPLAQALAKVGGVAVSWLVHVAHAAGSVPFAALPWQGGGTGAALLLLALVTGAVLLSYAPGRRIMAGCAAGAVAGALVLHALAPGWPPRGWLLVVCDVGQGDALVLAAAPHSAVVVDTGPEPRLVDRCLRDLGVRHVSLLVLTHMHADHVAGLPGVLRRRQVDAALVGGLQRPGGQSALVRARLKAAGVPVRRGEAGQRWRVEAMRITVLWPPSRFEGGSFPRWADDDADENNASVVLRVRWPGGVTAVLAGDVETEAQGLLAAGADVRAQVLKVPHHGSADYDPDFIRAVRPRLAITSVGADNPYGHPSLALLTRLRTGGARSLRTDLDGDVAVIRVPRGLASVSRGGHG